MRFKFIHWLKDYNNQAYLFILFVARQNKRKCGLRLHFTITKGKFIGEYPNVKKKRCVPKVNFRKEEMNEGIYKERGVRNSHMNSLFLKRIEVNFTKYKILFRVFSPTSTFFLRNKKKRVFVQR